MLPRSQIKRPDRRECERCGRVEVWDGDRTCWRIDVADGEKRVGAVFCIHEWDINGTFRPFE